MMFSKIYRCLLYDVLNSKTEEVNRRTGSLIRMLPEPHSFSVSLSRGKLPVAGNRRLYPETAAAEIAWFLSGSRKLTWLRKYCKIWDLFVESDGETVDAAYGYRWRKHFGRDQIDMAVKALAANPTDRRVYVSAWDPATDGLGAEDQKNVPCPIGFTLSIVDGRLNSALMIRSSDVFVGLPYDVMGHALLMDILAVTLRVYPGTLHVTLAHPHIYECHFDMAQESLDHEPQNNPPIMPGLNLDFVERHPDEYVYTMKRLADAVDWPVFAPRPEVVK